ncbi:MAG TPA: RNA polymerase sigma factor [Pirellulales bacterium]|jgi:RNA polymerase sigma-70 factor (ECF subfamily)|nr:RNA polymerase sigma factor [Pirellulales bacterium]
MKVFAESAGGLSASQLTAIPLSAIPLHAIPSPWPRSVAHESAPDGEAELVERAKRDPDAMAQLYREHYPPIARYVLRRVGNASEADDVVAEVFLMMVRSLPRYRQQGAPFRAWLYRLATDQIGRWARRRRRQLQKRLTDLAGRPAPDCDRAELLRVVLATLPDRLQSVLALHYLEQLPVAEITRVLGCAEGTVKSRLARGRELLRARLERRKDFDFDLGFGP